MAEVRKAVRRVTTGNEQLDALVDRTLTELASLLLPENDQDGRLNQRDQLRSLLTTMFAMAEDTAAGRADRLDLKIASAALAEMREAYRTFGPHRSRRKVTIFGSARTQPDDPLYDLTRDVARRLSEKHWMIVTGAGPGIMAAGLEGAGRENALGASIRLPFEAEATTLVEPENLVDMRYFFTRKLALLRESHGFIVMPGGFGTLDEAFELLTLVQTGKAEPVPIVFLGLGHGYWTAWQHFLEKVVDEGYISSTDSRLFRVTNSVEEAVEEIIGFYKNFHSIRWTGDTLIVRMERSPDDAQLAALNAEFGPYADAKGVWRSDPTSAERSEQDHLDLARIALNFNRRQPGRMRSLIDTVNQW